MSELPRSCRLMLMVNPQSGKGQALALYNSQIQRMLNEAGIPHTLVITGELMTPVPPHMNVQCSKINQSSVKQALHVYSFTHGNRLYFV